MKPEQRAMLCEVLENPADDAARLRFADWCEDNQLARKADYIRAAIALAKTPAFVPGVYGNNPEYDRLRKECDSLFREEDHFPRGRFPAVSSVRFERGFVAEIRMKLSSFIDHDIGKIFCREPVVAVNLDDRVPWSMMRLPNPEPSSPSGPGHAEPAWASWLAFDSGDSDFIPEPLWSLLRGGELFGSLLRGGGLFGKDRTARRYEDAVAARAALSQACVRHGRNLARLPPLPEL